MSQVLCCCCCSRYTVIYRNYNYNLLQTQDQARITGFHETVFFLELWLVGLTIVLSSGFGCRWFSWTSAGYTIAPADSGIPSRQRSAYSVARCLHSSRSLACRLGGVRWHTIWGQLGRLTDPAVREARVTKCFPLITGILLDGVGSRVTQWPPLMD